MHLSDQPVLRAVQFLLKALIDSPLCAKKPAHGGTQIESLFRQMTATGDHLLDALRLERGFDKSCPTKADGDALERWRNHRQSVDLMARDYVSAVSTWRETLLVECRLPDKAIAKAEAPLSVIFSFLGGFARLVPRAFR
jgi:hypothetical protein